MALAVFDVTKFSKDGVVIEPVQEQTTGTIRCASSGFLFADSVILMEQRSHLIPFQCVIKPRSQQAAHLIMMDE